MCDNTIAVTFVKARTLQAYSVDECCVMRRKNVRGHTRHSHPTCSLLSALLLDYLVSHSSLKSSLDHTLCNPVVWLPAPSSLKLAGPAPPYYYFYFGELAATLLTDTADNDLPLNSHTLSTMSQDAKPDNAVAQKTFMDLPREIYLMVCAYLSPQDLARLALLGKDCYLAVQQPLYDHVDITAWEQLTRLCRALTGIPIVSHISVK